MAKLDHLPAAQLSSLRLILSGRSYAEVADALSIEEEAVAGNARLAVSSLAGSSADALALAERGRIADWLLGQSEREPLVEGSPAARAFAQAASDELAAIDGALLPKLPDSGLAPPAAGEPARRPAKRFASSAPDGGAAEREPVPTPTDSPGTTGSVASGATDDAAAMPAGAGRGTPEISRRGGIALLAAAGAAILVGGLALAGVFDGGDSGSSTRTGAQTAPTVPQSTQAADTPDGKGGWTLRKRYTLKPIGGGKALGVAGLESKGNSNAMLVAGTGLEPGTTVGIWLTGASQPALVGFQKVSSKGEFTAVAPVPKSAPQATRLVVTGESVKPGQPVPTTPGREILASPFSL